ncbi:E3 ubiquitin-protein ligase ORTHRUS 2-like [Amaranthus tricolor]|uniref:E3 ubiquitin-protein ligase ORTHRUS 2-like n=1 Tax=Amaranthus tricolor TaxID=29722 RepID=UPI0025834296|nr:E3 ubiquitin-protein ligase ORTHRUS 2-like [Amaranthus tricolor]
MADQQLPCDGDGNCMLCKKKPSEVEKVLCKTCVTPWHVECLASPPESMASVDQWECPDCFSVEDVGKSVVPATVTGVGSELVAKIKAIEADASLSETEKARKRQELLSGSGSGGNDQGKVMDDNEILAILGDNMSCSFCMQLPERPVTTPCGHNFCLRCFEKWVGQGKRTCAKCRKGIPEKMASQPRINSSLVFAIRMARTTKSTTVAAPRVFQFVHNEDLPDQAFTTERAKKSGKANAKSGRIFVTIPHDHLGPITAEYDPVRNMGVLVGDCWEDRLACRQWGAHFPHVSGIAGQSNYGAQSVVLSGGYEDDEDHGEWFLYTGSGGRDLSGNKRTNKLQSSDQKFTSGNEALRTSCRKGYPVRVVRSHKEKRSHYAPESGVRYDGIYRIEKCWIKQGYQGFKVCRYLFVRCDNSPAPWTSDEHGDRPRPLPDVPELKKALQLTERKESPHWDFDAEEGCWKWKKPLPPSKWSKEKGTGTSTARSKKSSKAKILKEFSCQLCHKVLTLPITTPCAHNYCKACLDGAFEGQKFLRERKTGGRSLRTQKTVMKCPSCTTDISEFLQNAQVNRELMGVIESLMRKFEEEEKADGGENSGDLNENEEGVSDVEISTSDAEDTESKAVEEVAEVATEKPESKAVEVAEVATEKPQSDDGNLVEAAACKDPDVVVAAPSVAKKRGRPKKSAAAQGAANRTGGRKSRRVAEDGNNSPSSPLLVGSDNDLE